MMKAAKKLLAIALTLTCLSGLFAFTAAAEDFKRVEKDGSGWKVVGEIDGVPYHYACTEDGKPLDVGGNLHYDTDAEFVIIFGELCQYGGAGGDVVLPQQATGIGSLLNPLFTAPVSSLTLPSGFVFSSNYPYERSLSYMDELQTLTLTKGMTDVRGFWYCPKLETVNLPQGLTAIGAAFNECAQLKDVVVPASVTAIDKKAFEKSPTAIHGVIGSAAYTFAAEQKRYFVARTEKETPVIGDLSGNDEVDVGDLVLLARHLVGQFGLEDSFRPVADYTVDKAVDTGDLVAIARHLAG